MCISVCVCVCGYTHTHTHTCISIPYNFLNIYTKALIKRESKITFKNLAVYYYLTE